MDSEGRGRQASGKTGRLRYGLGSSQCALLVLWEGKLGKEDSPMLSHPADVLSGPGAVPVSADLKLEWDFLECCLSPGRESLPS